MSSLSNFLLPVHRFEDLKPGTVLPFIIESSSGVPRKAPPPPTLQRKLEGVDTKVGYSVSSTTHSGRRLPEAISLLYPALDADSASLFHLQLKESMEVPYDEDPADRDYEPIPPQTSLTCLCEIIDPKARPGSPDFKNRQAVIKFGTSEALQKEQEVYGLLQEMQGTFMPIFMGRIRVPNSGTEAILLEYVDHVAITSVLKTPKQMTDLVEASFVFFERLIELNITHDNWELENVATTADGQLVFFGFGQCRELRPLNPGNDILMAIKILVHQLEFHTDKVRAWSSKMYSRATALFLQCLEKKIYTSELTVKEKRLHYEIMRRFPPQ